MLRAYKYRIYPTKSQKEMFAKHFGCVRFVYNYFLTFSKIDFEKNLLTITKIREIKIVLHRNFLGKIKNITIEKTASGKYFASILVDTQQVEQKKQPISAATTIGIDTGIKNFATSSNGKVFENPKYLEKSTKRLTFLQKKHSRKVARSLASVALGKFYEMLSYKCAWRGAKKPLRQQQRGNSQLFFFIFVVN